MLFIKSKIQFFESKSQRTYWWGESCNGCLSSQRYNFLKANHNSFKMLSISGIVVYQVKDTIFWKQITTVGWLGNDSHCCLSSQRYNFLKANHNIYSLTWAGTRVVYQVKDTIFWKQITTYRQGLGISCLLFIKSKIQFFESKSQRETRHGETDYRCLSSQRYNFLKANHNFFK